MQNNKESNIISSEYYDENYFEWQRKSGDLGGWANVDKYRDTVRPSSTVLDFGCGGGFLLANLNCRQRIGIDPNPAARAEAVANGVMAFRDVADALASLGPETIDVIISDNALEHALEPWRELSAMRDLLKPQGRLHVVVPCEGVGWKYDPKDVNKHVYSWSPQSLGNLLCSAGYEVVYSRPYVHKWPPFGMARILRKAGRTPFNLASRIWGRIDRRWFQVEAVGRKVT